MTKVLLAGGFGTNLNPHSACRTGLLNSAWDYITVAVGNAAVKGAALLLSYDNAMNDMEILRKNTHYIDLSEDKKFSQMFLQDMAF